MHFRFLAEPNSKGYLERVPSWGWPDFLSLLQGPERVGESLREEATQGGGVVVHV